MLVVDGRGAPALAQAGFAHLHVLWHHLVELALLLGGDGGLGGFRSREHILVVVVFAGEDKPQQQGKQGRQQPHGKANQQPVSGENAADQPGSPAGDREQNAGDSGKERRALFQQRPVAAAVCQGQQVLPAGEHRPHAVQCRRAEHTVPHGFPRPFHAAGAHIGGHRGQLGEKQRDGIAYDDQHQPGGAYAVGPVHPGVLEQDEEAQHQGKPQLANQPVDQDLIGAHGRGEQQRHVRQCKHGGVGRTAPRSEHHQEHHSVKQHHNGGQLLGIAQFFQVIGAAGKGGKGKQRH